MAALLADYLDRMNGIDLRIARILDAADDVPLEVLVRRLIAGGFDRIPLPGHGATLERWRVLERVARHDLALVKLYESHTDALAILAEIEPPYTPRPGVLYAVWAAEARVDPITIRPAEPASSFCDHDASHVVIDGRKSWCSGAGIVDAALMTAVDAAGQRHLVEIDLGSAGITIDRSRWHAVGMRGSGSFDVVCDGVRARIVGAAGSYLERPGFWHGGAGIAACWYGAAAAIGTRVRDLQAGRDDVHALAHLGAIDAALASGGALLRETAHAIDAAPVADAVHIVLRVRGAISDLCDVVVHHAGRAVGAGPLCNEARLAHLFADLPIFVRQSRTEHDRVAQSRALLSESGADSGAAREVGWPL